MLPVCLVAVLLAAPDIVIEDFEGQDWGTWTAEGTCFGASPVTGTLPGQMPLSGLHGRGCVSTYVGGDGATGSLTSPPFRIERSWIHFLLGGGMKPDEAYMELLVGGEAVRTATGPNDKPGGTERLQWMSWDVRDLVGKEAVLRIVDRATGGWGHINVDWILQSGDETKEQRMTFRATSRYLILPVRTGAPMRKLTLREGASILRDFDIELAGGEPEFWTFLDLAPLAGRELSLTLDGVDDAATLDAVRQADEVPGFEDLYREPLRPQFHFTSRRGWNNDPNGLVYLDGEYHLFYQHNPYGWNWGNMHWGHAVSRDLVRWQELPIALYPVAPGDGVFSGSAAIDRANTGGFPEGEAPPLVACFTSTSRGECLAYSTDRGRTFSEIETNPVVAHQGRDPKILWHAPSERWVMAVYDEQGESQGIAFYTSPDLRQWEFASRIEGYFECPELFPLALDGDPARLRWVLYAASGEYAIGDFDGRTFTPEGPKQRYNWGNCFYASQTFSDIPAEDGRRIQIAWGTNATPGMPFNQMMDFPVELSLRTTEEGPRLFSNPVREVALLHGSETRLSDVALGAENPLAGVAGEGFHIKLTLEPGSAREAVLYVRGIPVTYDFARQVVRVLDREAPLPLTEGSVTLELLVDRTSLELWGGGGRVYMPTGFLFDPATRGLSLLARGGSATAREVSVWEMRPGWE